VLLRRTADRAVGTDPASTTAMSSLITPHKHEQLAAAAPLPADEPNASTARHDLDDNEALEVDDSAGNQFRM